MRQILPAPAGLLLALVLNGCDSRPDTFGKSYGECLSKVPRQSDAIATKTAMDLCQHHFEKGPAVYTELGSSGGMMTNADGTASFEFRISNDRPDIIVTGFTVTVTFFRGAANPGNKLAEYHWSFRDQVLPRRQLLTYGALDAKKVAELIKRYSSAKSGFDPDARVLTDQDPLAGSVYSYRAKIDSQLFVRTN